MAGYTRQSTFADGDTITAALFNNEYNQLFNAFSNINGHKHDGTAAEGPVIGLIGDAGETSPNNKVLIDTTNNHIEFYVEVSSSSVQQLYIADGAIVPVTDSDIDIGTTSLRFKDAYIDTVTTTGNVAVGGNLTVTGTTTFNGGTITMGDAATDNVVFGADVDSNIIPDDDDSYDLGSSSQEWRNLYIDGTANIDSLIADTADINGGTIDGATIATSDITVGSGKTLDVSAGTLTLADNQISGDKVEGGTIAATTITTLASTTGNITTVNSTTTNATTVDSTNIEVTNLKAKDGTAAGSIANSTGVVTLASSVLTTTDINGGTIDGSTIATSDITVGTGKTLDVSSGTLTLADNQISGDKVEGGTIAATTITDLTFGSLNDGTITVTAFADEDDMSSNSATLVPTQQSVKAYVDSQVTAQDLDFQGDSGGALSIDLDSESLTIAGGTGLDTVGSGNTITVNIDSTVATLTGTQTLTNKTLTSPDVNTPDIDGGTIDGTVIGGATPAAGTFTTLTANTSITGTLATAAQPNITSVGTLSSLTTSGNVIVGGNLTVNGTTTTLNTATLDVEDKNITLNYGSGDTTGSANGAGITIQDAVDASTDASILWDTTNDEFDFSHPINVTGKITGTGTSVFTNLDISGDVDVDGTLETDALTIGGVTSVPFEAADHSKLDGIEANATADQTASEIRTLVGSASDSNVFTDADHSKLNAIEASADVTDTANVTSAGALMDSELTSIADVKALNQSVVSGATPTFTTTNFTDATNKRFMTDAQETKLDSVESGATADQTAAEIRTLVESASDSNVFTDADHSKLNGIEASATADQTAAEIRTLVESATDSNVFTDADHSKLNGIAANANNYVLPTNLAGDDINIDTGALTGATVISDLDFNITTNTSGLVTDANASVATRNLTLANLGYTGATDATNNTGTVTSVGISTSAGLDGGGTITSSGSVTISLDLSELTDMTAGVSGANDELILLDSGAERRKRIGEINLGQFNNDQGWTSNTGDITAVTVSGNVTGGGTSGSVGIGFTSTPSFTDVYVADQILHSDDADTYMQFHATNEWRVVAGGYERFAIGLNVVVNEDSHNSDFRVESNGNANMLFVDGGNDRVGVGINNPTRTFEVNSGSANAVARFESTDSRASLEFKDSAGTASIGNIGNHLSFLPTGVERMVLNDEGGLVVTPTAGGHAVFNEGSVDADFRVESNTSTHALFVNGGNSRVGINDSAPDRELEVRGDDASTSHTVGIKVKNTNVGTGSIAGIVFENYDNNAAYIRSIRSGSTAGILTFGINDGGNIAESDISEKLRISSFLVEPESGVNIGSIRNNGVNVSTSAVNVLDLGSVNSSGDKGKGRYLVTVCATSGTVGTAGSAIYGLSSSGAVYLYETVNANSVSFGSSGANVTAHLSSGTYTMHVNAIPLSVDN